MTHYYRGLLTLDEPDPDGRTEVPVEQIGKGMFSRAYTTKTGTPYVYLITQEEDEGDYSKRALEEFNRDDSSPYIPKVVDVGCLDNGACVYRMPVYHAPLRKSDSARAWKQYRALRRCWEDAEDIVRRDLQHRHGFVRAWHHQYIHSGHRIMDEVIECAQKSKAVPNGLVRALEELRDALSNYGADYSFEFSPRNLATTEGGHLILLDVTFSLESVARKRR